MKSKQNLPDRAQNVYNFLMAKSRYTTLEYVLLALVPYTRQNLLLAYKPSRFFNELERVSGSNRDSLRSTLARAQRTGLVQRIDGVPRLTKTGLQRVARFQARRISKQGQLMVIFDIPEEFVGQRRKFRNYLKMLEFKQVQKSVWVTQYDYRDEIRQAVNDLRIGRFVQLYECAKLYP